MALKDNIKWKPCPFCGGTNIRVNNEDDFSDSPLMIASCTECQTDVYFFTRGQHMSYPEALLRLADKWNRRATA